MAGDWIKMRTDMYRDPRVSVMAAALMAQDGELAAHVSQNCQRDMTITRNVMRNVTVGALVSVWGVMRQRGKRNGDDLVCSGVTLEVLDDIADLPGFGAAMAAAKWVEQDADGLEFPRFFEEYNVDPGEGAKSKNADRQQRYRDRKKDADKADKRDVTRDVTVTPREEKRREEKEPKEEGADNPPPAAPSDPQGTQPEGKKPSRATPPRTFDVWQKQLAEAGEHSIPTGHASRVYAKTVGLPPEFLHLNWLVFVRRYSGTAKRYSDWGLVFLNSLKERWFQLWILKEGEGYILTTVGKQAEIEFKEELQ